MAGVTALIIVISILNGFQEITEEKIMSFDPHLTIELTQEIENNNQNSLKNKLIQYLETNSNVTSYSEVKSGDIALLFNKNFSFIKLKSYTKKDDEMLTFFNESIVMGKENNTENLPNILIGLGISNSLKIFPGAIIDIYSVSMIEYNIRTYRNIKPVKAYVSGVFQSNNAEYDNYLSIGNNQLSNRLYKKNKSTKIEIKINNPYQIQEFTNNIQSKFKNNLHQFTTTTWVELNSGLLNIMKFEKISTFIVLTLIIIIAVFNLLASLSMTVENKVKDIGVLRSIGLSKKDIKIIFRYEGLLNGIIGTMLGLSLGISFCYLQINYQFITFDIANIISNSLPISMKMADILLITILSIGLSYLSVIYPSNKASKALISDSIK